MEDPTILREQNIYSNKRKGQLIMLESGSNNSTKYLLEKILERDNMNKAYLQVKRNNGAPGVDAIEVGEVLSYLKKNGENLIEELMSGKYQPQPVRRVEIPKPDGGKRLIGIPTVVDRIIQQSISQVLIPIYEEKFSDSSYGFRPNRNCHQAINKAKEYISEGYEYVIDIDLERFFDTVNHHKLINLIGKEIEDKRVVKLIWKYLKSGIMIGSQVIDTEEGTPQGGNLSPLLSNIILNELDKELEKRGHKFCRYADDCNIYVKSIKSGNRVMAGITDYIEKRLKLKVNQKKSGVGSPYERKFLGFNFYKGKDGKVKIRIHPKSIEKLKKKVRKIMPRKNERNIAEIIRELKPIIQGWSNYYKIDELKSLSTIDCWIRRRMRQAIWQTWKRIRTRYDRLRKLGIKHIPAIQIANTRKGSWTIALSPIIHQALPNEYFEKLGFRSLSSYCLT